MNALVCGSLVFINVTYWLEVADILFLFHVVPELFYLINVTFMDVFYSFTASKP